MTQKDPGRSGERSILVGAGEFFLDLIFYDLPRLPDFGEELKTENFAFSLGGGAAISTAAAARLGRSTQLLTVWGNSPLDQAARLRLSEFQVDCFGSRIESKSSSGVTVAVSTRADRYFLTFMGANRQVEDFLLSEEAFEQMAAAGHVHFALTASRWGPFHALVNRLAARGVTVSWDLGWNPDAAASPDFKELVAELDVVFFNEMEALRYTDTCDSTEALRRLSSASNTVVIKRGGTGSVGIEQQGEPVVALGLAVRTVDTTGAGDAFNGGFLHAWMEGTTLRDALLAGNICGALSTRAAGGVLALPAREEFDQKFAEMRSAD